jgi:putative aldouronate transport system substrate-binding protein
MSTAYHNNRQYAKAALQTSGQDPLFWVREDWRLQLGLPEPKTIDDFINIAQAFVDNDMAGNRMTIGLELQSPVAGRYNGSYLADPFFNEVGAFPRSWIDDGTGRIIYGSVAPQAREGLRTVRDLYARGLISRDYVTKDHRASVAAGHTGVVIGPWWICGNLLATTVQNNPDNYWRVFTWRSSKTGGRYTIRPDVNNQWLVVRRGYSNPEIAVRMMNLIAEVRCFTDGFVLTAEEERRYEVFLPLNVRDAYFGRPGINWAAWPISLQVDFDDYVLRHARVERQDLELFRAGNTAHFTPSYMEILRDINSYSNGTDRSLQPWRFYHRFIGKQFTYSDANFITIKHAYYPYTTDTMQARWSHLTDLENLAYNSIIMGQQPLEFFDTFVQQWHAQGGTTITAEVNRQFRR